MNIRKNVLKLLVSGIVALFCFGAIKPVPPLKTSESIQPHLTQPSNAQKLEINEAYGKLPLAFEINEGQSDSQVKFLSRGNGYTLFLTPAEAVLSLRHNTSKFPNELKTKTEADDVVRMRINGGNRLCKVVGEDKLSGISSYFVGNDPSRWRTKVVQYAKVRFKDIYPGVDLVYYGNQGKLEYDFVVKPGADPSVIQAAWMGAKETRVENGSLVLKVGTKNSPSGNGKKVVFKAPMVYQEIDGVRKPIESRYVLAGKNKMGFKVATYDSTRPLIIDPQLDYSTFLGGIYADGINNIWVDSSGNAYLHGNTASTNFPTTAGAFQTTLGGPTADNSFVAKLNPSGTALVFSTLIGGNNSETAFGLYVDSGGNIYLTGYTTSTNYPTTAGAFQTALTGSDNAYVTKLNPTGSALVYSTYLGGNSADAGTGIAADGAGNAYVDGYTRSTNFPTTAGSYQTTMPGPQSAFVAELNPTGTGLVYSTFLGGSGNDTASGIVLDSGGNVYVAGGTDSTNFPTTAGAFQVSNGGTYNAFVAKLNPTGTGLVYSTYIGGNGTDQGEAVVVDGSGNAYVTGQTSSTNFPTTAGAYQTVLAGTINAFVLKLNATGTALVFSTYLGGSGSDAGVRIAIDSSGNSYVVGNTQSANFPISPGAFQTSYGGNGDVFISKLNPTGGLVYSTFLGGNNDDFGVGISLDSAGSVYVTGGTFSANFPTTAGAYQTVFGGGSYSDGFVTKFDVTAFYTPTPGASTSTPTSSPTSTPTASFTSTPTSAASASTTVTPSVTISPSTTPTQVTILASQGANPPPNSNQLAGATNVPAQQVVFTNPSNGPATLTSLTLSVAGSGNPSDITSVTLYENGVALGTTTFSGTTATFSFSSLLPASSSVTFVVTANFYGSASGSYSFSATGAAGTNGRALLFSDLPVSGATIIISAPTFTFTPSTTLTPGTPTFTPSFTPTITPTGSVTATASPIPSATPTTTGTYTPTFTFTFTPTFTITVAPSSTSTPTFSPTVVTVSASQGTNPPGNSNQLPGAGNVPVQQIQFTNPANGPVTLTSLTVTETGTGPASAITSLTLLRNGVPVAAANFNGSTATFDLNDTLGASGSATYQVVANYSSLAPAGTYSFSATGAAGTNGQPLLFSGLPVGGATVTVSTATLTPTSTGTLVITSTPTSTPTVTTLQALQGSGAPGNSTQVPGAVDVPVEQVQFINTGGAATMTSLTLTESGGPVSGISSVTLLKNGVPIATSSFTGSTAVFNFNDVIGAGGGALYQVQVNYTSDAALGTYSFSATGAAGTNGQPLAFNGLPVAGSTVTVVAATATPTSTFTITPTGTLTPAFTSTSTPTPMAVTIQVGAGSGAPGGSDQNAGAQNVPAGQVQFTNPGNSPATITSLTLTESGLPPTGVSSVVLLRNGVPIATAGFNGSNAVFNFNHVVPAGRSTTYEVQVNYSSAAASGSYQFSVSAMTGNNGFPLGFRGLPLAGAVITINPKTPTPLPTGTPGNDVLNLSLNLFHSGTQSLSIHAAAAGYPGHFYLRVYNSVGELIRVLDDREISAAWDQWYQWDGTNTQQRPVASGVYIIQMSGPFVVHTARVIVIH